jgi:hypothetical protein
MIRVESVAVGFARVLTDLVAQDISQLAAGEPAAGGLGGADSAAGASDVGTCCRRAVVWGRDGLCVVDGGYGRAERGHGVGLSRLHGGGETAP